ncbi:MAG: formylglycine-generating enzyme family protein [Verrucomicrobia bacterium]|nr:formylglycine-generating enzyme family protein [Verrucomicrobiota bacterium]
MTVRPVLAVCGSLLIGGWLGAGSEPIAADPAGPKSEIVRQWRAGPAGQSFRDRHDDFLKKVGADADFGFVVASIKVPMVFVPPGKFTMGDEGGEDDERPETEVAITRGFWLGRYEITQEEWRTVMNLSPSHYKGANRPVEFISWKAAQEFCQRLTVREQSAGRLPRGYVYRLPTEAEWEYACRLGTEGGAPGVQPETGWYATNGKEMSHPVGEKLPNALGLYDVFGNVSEWCVDWYGKYPGGQVRDYVGPINGEFRVARGGNSFDIAYGCRPTYRTGAEPIVRSAGIGMRLALAPELIR